MKSQNGTRKKDDMTKGKKKFPLYLGDPKFYSNLFKYYAWFFSVVLFLLGCVFLYDGAYLSGAIILILAGFNFPPLKKLMVSIPGFLKLIINLALVLLIFKSIAVSQ